ncbi:hypothetical protein D3C80_1815570 [compost metagenome]
MIHELKTWPEHFENVWNLSKPFELRKNDRNYQLGDILILKEFEWQNQKYTGRVQNVEVTSILKNFKGIEKGYCILGIEHCNRKIKKP